MLALGGIGGSVGAQKDFERIAKTNGLKGVAWESHADCSVENTT